MMVKAFLAILLLMLVQGAPTPPKWGGNPHFTVRVLMDFKLKWNYTYKYDSSLKAEVWAHDAG